MPKCLNCNGKMKRIYLRTTTNKKGKWNSIGYICLVCFKVYLDINKEV